MFEKYVDNVNIKYIYKSSSYPSSIILKSRNKEDPIVQLNLDCDHELYVKEYNKLHDSLCNWIDQEKKLHDKLGYATDSSFIFLFRNAAILNLPGNLESIETTYTEQPYQVFSRFTNYLASIELIFSPVFLDAIKGRFFYHLLSSKVKYNLSWKYSDLYRLIYYYNWTYLIPIYQSTNTPILDNKIELV